MDKRSISLSLLDEIKDLADQRASSEEVKTVKLDTPLKQQATPTSTSSLSLELCKALEDVHVSISQSAAAEESQRQAELEEETRQAQLKRKTTFHSQSNEVEALLASEQARREQVAEQRRLEIMRLEYEAAVARGEDVELPEELKPKPKVLPEQLPDLMNAPQSMVSKEVPQTKLGLYIAVASSVAVAAAAIIFTLTPPPLQELPKLTAGMSLELHKAHITELKEQAEIARQKELKRQQEIARRAAELEAKRQAELAAAAEQKSSKKVKRRAKKKKQRKGRLKIKLGGTQF